MIVLPTRVELVSNSDICSFLADVEYGIQPASGDRLFIDELSEVLKVAYICHYIKSGKSLVVLEKSKYDDYNDLLKTLDWFKSLYEIYDIRSNGDPKSYYLLFRSLLKLLGLSNTVRPVVSDVSLRVLAEACRTLLLAELRHTGTVVDADDLNEHIAKLHTIAIGIKESRKIDDSDLSIIELASHWDEYLQQFFDCKWKG